ncbi:hypothetical protein CPB85DRAFT_1258418 [Mucidula mucida]|nr:hypothetical protein CPB85DRAFT_1258418 [Mucidula mucida]
MSCPFHCGRVEGQEGKRSRISPSDSSSVSESSDDSVVLALDFRLANNERSELGNDRMCDLVWECDSGSGVDRRQEDDEELPEVFMKRWVRVGDKFDRNREEDSNSHESTLTTDCLRMVKTFMSAKKAERGRQKRFVDSALQLTGGSSANVRVSLYVRHAIAALFFKPTSVRCYHPNPLRDTKCEIGASSVQITAPSRFSSHGSTSLNPRCRALPGESRVGTRLNKARGPCQGPLPFGLPKPIQCPMPPPFDVHIPTYPMIGPPGSFAPDLDPHFGPQVVMDHIYHDTMMHLIPEGPLLPSYPDEIPREWTVGVSC